MHPVQPTEATEQVRMEARLPVSIRDHGPCRWHQRLGAAAPNPAKLSQLDRIWISPLNPLRGLLPSRPPGEAGGNPPRSPNAPRLTRHKFIIPPATIVHEAEI